MDRTIKVTGKGRIAVKPDRIRLGITQQKTEKTYEEAMRESAAQKAALTEELEKIGFKKEDLKTKNFHISTEYEGYQDENNQWRNRMVGYHFNHQLKLEFPADNEMLGRVLQALINSCAEPDFSIQYTVSNPEAAKNELLRMAVKDSRAKALVLCDAARVELEEILSIDYTWEEMDIVSAPVNAMMLRKCDAGMADSKNGIAMDIEADDINVTDTVTITWQIGRISSQNCLC